MGLGRILLLSVFPCGAPGSVLVTVDKVADIGTLTCGEVVAVELRGVGEYLLAQGVVGLGVVSAASLLEFLLQRYGEFVVGLGSLEAVDLILRYGYQAPARAAGSVTRAPDVDAALIVEAGVVTVRVEAECGVLRIVDGPRSVGLDDGEALLCLGLVRKAHDRAVLRSGSLVEILAGLDVLNSEVAVGQIGHLPNIVGGVLQMCPARGAVVVDVDVNVVVVVGIYSIVALETIVAVGNGVDLSLVCLYGSLQIGGRGLVVGGSRISLRRESVDCGVGIGHIVNGSLGVRHTEFVAYGSAVSHVVVLESQRAHVVEIGTGAHVGHHFGRHFAQEPRRGRVGVTGIEAERTGCAGAAVMTVLVERTGRIDVIEIILGAQVILAGMIKMTGELRILERRGQAYPFAVTVLVTLAQILLGSHVLYGVVDTGIGQRAVIVLGGVLPLLVLPDKLVVEAVELAPAGMVLVVDIPCVVAVVSLIECAVGSLDIVVAAVLDGHEVILIVHGSLAVVEVVEVSLPLSCGVRLGGSVDGLGIAGPERIVEVFGLYEARVGAVGIVRLDAGLVVVQQVIEGSLGVSAAVRKTTDVPYVGILVLRVEGDVVVAHIKLVGQEYAAVAVTTIARVRALRGEDVRYGIGRRLPVGSSGTVLHGAVVDAVVGLRVIALVGDDTESLGAGRIVNPCIGIGIDAYRTVLVPYKVKVLARSLALDVILVPAGHGVGSLRLLEYPDDGVGHFENRVDGLARVAVAIGPFRPIPGHEVMSCGGRTTSSLKDHLHAVLNLFGRKHPTDHQLSIRACGSHYGHHSKK